MYPLDANSDATLFSVFTSALAFATMAQVVVEIRSWRRSRYRGSGGAGSSVPVPHAVAARSSILLSLAGLLLVGVQTRGAAIGMVAVLAAGQLVRRKHTTQYLAICSIVAAIPPHVPRLGVEGHVPWGAYAAGASALAMLYFGGAITKLQSAQFRSGASLYIISVRLRRRWSLHGNQRRVRGRTWRACALTIVFVELLIPVGLILPQTSIPTAVTGAAMHAGFLLIDPGRLLPFQSVTVGSYACAIAMTQAWPA